MLFYLNCTGKFLSVKVTIYILVYRVSIMDSTKRHHTIYKELRNFKAEKYMICWSINYWGGEDVEKASWEKYWESMLKEIVLGQIQALLKITLFFWWETWEKMNSGQWGEHKNINAKKLTGNRMIRESGIGEWGE